MTPKTKMSPAEIVARVGLREPFLREIFYTPDQDNITMQFYNNTALRRVKEILDEIQEKCGYTMYEAFDFEENIAVLYNLD